MKNFIRCSVLLTFIQFPIFGQIIPTEIQYNPPEFGQDSLEYLEIFNNSGQDINLEGYAFTEGISFTFEESIFPKDSYLVLAVNGPAFTNAYGFEPFAEWESGALNNSGEAIELRDATGNVLFNTSYSDRNAWPSAPDGNGPSLELCDLNDDFTLASSWGVATSATGILIDSTEIFGTPGQTNAADCGDRFDHRIEVTSFEFTPADITITEGEVVLWENLEGVHNVDGRQATYPNNPESFYSGQPEPEGWTYSHTFNLVGEYTYECTPHAGLNMVGTITVEPEEVDPQEYPPYDIAVVTTNNPEGVPDSLGIKCAIQGIIHGANRRDNGYLFTLIDSNGVGIGVFRPTSIGPYRPTQGDEVSIEGTISQFNGLTQIEVDNIQLISQNNTIVMPGNNSNSPLSETSESQYVFIGPLTFVDPSQWDDSGNSFNFEAESQTGIRYDIRIDRNTELAGLSEPPLPNGFDDSFILYGVGGQFDPDLPYDEGYQLLPSFSTDFEATTSFSTIQKSQLTIYPNPVSERLHIVNIPPETEIVTIYTPKGKVWKTISNPPATLDIEVNEALPGHYILHIYGAGINDSKHLIIK
jgi:plastocyanin